MRKFSIIFISLLFFLYGLIRVGVGLSLLGQELGVIDFEAFQDPVKEVAEFLNKDAHTPLIHVSPAGYLSFILLMGISLVIGAIGSLRNKMYGTKSLAGFLVLYGSLFINFQTINPKIIHLIVSFLLFLALLWLKKGQIKKKGLININDSNMG
jgi:hypothetical protein